MFATHWLAIKSLEIYQNDIPVGVNSPIKFQEVEILFCKLVSCIKKKTTKKLKFQALNSIICRLQCKRSLDPAIFTFHILYLSRLNIEKHVKVKLFNKKKDFSFAFKFY